MVQENGVDVALLELELSDSPDTIYAEAVKSVRPGFVSFDLVLDKSPQYINFIYEEETPALAPVYVISIADGNIVGVFDLLEEAVDVFVTKSDEGLGLTLKQTYLHRTV